jgi:hypothetical protein
VTFNYDTLLDRACRTVLGLKLITPEAYIGEGDYMVLKLHGSIDWWEEVDPPRKELTGGDIERANQLIDMVGRYQRTGRYCMAGQDLNGWGRFDRRSQCRWFRRQATTLRAHETTSTCWTR